jgi:antitoxin VapB
VASVKLSSPRALPTAPARKYLFSERSDAVDDTQTTQTAKLFKHDGSQAARLPKDFHLPGKEVRVRRLGRGVLLEPMERSIEVIKAIFAEIDRLVGTNFRPEQPPMPPVDDVSFDQ